MAGLTFTQAEAVAKAAMDSARSHGFELAVAIVDEGGWPHIQTRMDGAFPAAADAALAKARCAALFRRPTSDFSTRVKDGMPLAHLPHVVPLGGGVLLERDGKVFGALGVSGAREDTETALAEQIAAAFAVAGIATQ
ncbi:GlcG/HbpS family heme-binding protein [Pelagibacterium halotolerans]|uniref:GlcG protein n=1 Tax=Pelagibacterium halotolerans (strain DSM 22347 / JCM 15775 / CGMCC 1.7692 / B2) TaxID=1082931 RepID=G4R7U8_PELHB|nr:heme-binding protein [Pelagibacterium halotolerans]AEQ50243.1 glcG protein [Pelagibacterium halotolerans B2]QJR19761.1 heme-binding protein [Pelagibacterium halotolerans]SEA51696.1 glc operon protein GlcG [Pelagibacterium halotolerans]